MSRKRPAPGSAAPIQITTSSPPNAHQAGYINPSLQSPTSTTINSNGIAATATPYAHINGVTSSPNSVVESSDIYSVANGGRLSAAANNATQALNLAMNDNQVARITNRNSSLMRIPQTPYYPPPGPNPPLGDNPHATQLPLNAPGLGNGLGSNLDAIYGDLAALIRKAKGKKTNIPPFVQKLSQFVNDPKCDHLIRWSPSGTSFLVLDEDEFSKTLIPDLFKHNNYASFVRQLNMYGFHKVVGLADGSLKTSEQRSKPPSEYKNQYFIRGMPELMWLIQKPKNTAKRSKGRKKCKTEDSDEEAGSDGEVVNTSNLAEDGHLQANGGFIEAPPTQIASKTDLGAFLQQLEQVRQHQAVISNAINRLRKDHNQLYEQSIAFQTLHDRHETSISAILTFLATVYDKSLAGHLNGQTLANLFQGAVDSSQTGGQVMGNPSTAVANMGRAGVVGTGTGQPRTFKRRPLMLPPAPQVNGQISADVLKNQNGGAQGQQPQQQQQGSPVPFSTYQSPSIQEVFPPASGALSPGPNSPGPGHSHLNPNLSPNFFSTLYSSMQNSNDPHLSAANQNALTPRLLRRAITPLLQVAEQNQALQQHNNKVAETRTVLDQVKVMQDQQNENINRLMEIVGPYTAKESTHTHPISSSLPASPANTTTTAPPQPVATKTAPASPAPVTAAGAGAAVRAAGTGDAEVIDDVSANGVTLLPSQTPSPTTNNTYVNVPVVGDPAMVSGTEGAVFDDIDQYLASDWMPEMDHYNPADDGVNGASQSLSEVNLDPTMFLEETQYTSPGYLPNLASMPPNGMMGTSQDGGIAGTGAAGGLGRTGQGGGGLDGGGQIMGSNSSTATGSPNSPAAFSDGVGVGLIDVGVAGVGAATEEVPGSAKKKRRTG
ncbi:hypothetical protein BDZ91DRAFT_793157 [Kalaharituber pfeilii]|nr:hypothetical protein BDZ91DRAFT_793157 [Kalaharituber pfeilii]